MAARRSKEEIIRDLELKIQKLKERSKKEVKLTKNSSGISDAILAIENAAAQNDVAVSEVIRAIAKFKRTGLKIEG